MTQQAATSPSSPAPTVGIVGLGRIGTVLLAALRRFAPDVPVLAAGRDLARAAAVSERHGGAEVVSPDALAERADLVLLCVPPETYREAVATLAPRMRADAILVSVTNAVSLEDLGRWCERPVVKIIPSPAHAAGRGVCLVTPGPRSQAADVARVSGVLARFSRPVLVDAADSRVASNLAGCAPAILAAFCASFLDANAAHAQRLSVSDLRAMMAESVLALGALLDEGSTFEEVVARTATPGGTTEAAITALGAPALCERIVAATYHREAQLLGLPPPDARRGQPRSAVRG